MTDASAVPPGQRRSRLVLLGLVGLFTLPILTAWLLTLHPFGWMPSQTLNHGTLIDPPQPLHTEAWQAGGGGPVDVTGPWGLWSVLYVGPAGCDAACRALADALARMRLSLGRELARVNGYVVVPEGTAPLPAVDDFTVATAPPDSLAAIRQPLTDDGPVPAIYLVDYRGFLVMGYSADADLAGIRKDLRRLLRASDRD